MVRVKAGERIEAAAEICRRPQGQPFHGLRAVQPLGLMLLSELVEEWVSLTSWMCCATAKLKWAQLPI